MPGESGSQLESQIAELNSTAVIFSSLAKNFLNTSLSVGNNGLSRATVPYATIGQIQRELQVAPNLETITSTLNTALGKLQSINTQTARQSYEASKALTDPLLQKAKQDVTDLQKLIDSFNAISSTVLNHLRNILRELENSADSNRRLGSQDIQNQFKTAETQTDSFEASTRKLLRSLDDTRIRLVSAYEATYNLLPSVLQLASVKPHELNEATTRREEAIATSRHP